MEKKSTWKKVGLERSYITSLRFMLKPQKHPKPLVTSIFFFACNWYAALVPSHHRLGQCGVSTWLAYNHLRQAKPSQCAGSILPANEQRLGRCITSTWLANGQPRRLGRCAALTWPTNGHPRRPNWYENVIPARISIDLLWFPGSDSYKIYPSLIGSSLVTLIQN
jgi:hypothetical protein